MPDAFFDTLARHARDHAHAPALATIDPDGATGHMLDYGTLWRAIEQYASQVASKGDMTCPEPLALPNGPQFVVRFLGILRAGRVALPFHPRTPQSERQQTIRACRGASLPGGGIVLRSSGTTGLPKLVHRDGASLDAVAANTAEAVGIHSDDHVLVTIPQCHSYGIENGLLAPFYAGATIHVCDGFEPAAVLRQWREGKATVMPCVPFMLEVLADCGDGGRAGALRLVYSAGATLPAKVFETFTHRYARKPGQLYGATEIGSVTFNDPSRFGFDPMAVGLPMAGVEVRIEKDDGQVAVRAPSMLRSFVDAECEKLSDDGFFLTGDLGQIRSDGVLTITGRLKLLIDIGGLKVNPLEVEEVICEHPNVRECVVVPSPVTQTLVRLKACVVPRGDALDTDDLRRFARERLAGYKVPRIIELRDDLPRSPLGKVQRQQLVEEALR